MNGLWITNLWFWLAALPALAVTGVLAQMILSLFRPCGCFRLRGHEISVRWWSIPLFSCLCGCLWILAVVAVVRCIR